MRCHAYVMISDLITDMMMIVYVMISDLITDMISDRRPVGRMAQGRCRPVRLSLRLCAGRRGGAEGGQRGASGSPRLLPLLHRRPLGPARRRGQCQRSGWTPRPPLWPFLMVPCLARKREEQCERQVNEKSEGKERMND